MDAAEQSVKHIDALVRRIEDRDEVIGTVVAVTDRIIDIVDDIAEASRFLYQLNLPMFTSCQIHPVFSVSWKAATALYKACPISRLLLYMFYNLTDL